jgi:hypothetical protein
MTPGAAPSTSAWRVGSDARCFAVSARRVRAANVPPYDGPRDGTGYRDLLPWGSWCRY